GEVARAAAEVEELHESGAVVAVRVRDGCEPYLVDLAVEERGDAVARIEEDAVRLVEHPRGDQRRGEENYSRRVHGSQYFTRNRGRLVRRAIISLACNAQWRKVDRSTTPTNKMPAPR